MWLIASGTGNTICLRFFPSLHRHRACYKARLPLGLQPSAIVNSSLRSGNFSEHVRRCITTTHVQYTQHLGGTIIVYTVMRVRINATSHSTAMVLCEVSADCKGCSLILSRTRRCWTIYAKQLPLSKHSRTTLAHHWAWDERRTSRKFPKRNDGDGPGMLLSFQRMAALDPYHRNCKKWLTSAHQTQLHIITEDKMG